MPQIVEKLFHRLEELLIAASISVELIRGAIANIMAETKLEPFIEIFDLLDQTSVSEGDEQRIRNDIASLKIKTILELFSQIKILISRKTYFGSTNYSAATAAFYTANRMRAVFEQMLVANKIPQKNAKKAVDDLEPDIFSETMAKLKLVSSNLKAIRAQNQTDLLIKFDIEGKQKESITSVVIGTLNKRKYSLRKSEV